MPTSSRVAAIGLAFGCAASLTLALPVGRVQAQSNEAVSGSQSMLGQSAKPKLPPAEIPVASVNTKTVGVAQRSGLDQDAALAMASRLDGAGGGVSSSELLAALHDAAAAGQPIALWRLGVMYENGEGVQKDNVKAFRFFSQIANDHADTPPRSLEADIVAQSFVKIGEYYEEGLPSAGIKPDTSHAHALLLHAATYFGDADAQYRVGKLYLDKKSYDYNPLQAARWLSLAARKGQALAQARLGDMLFNGEGIQAQPVEGLMWLTLAHRRTQGTTDEAWIGKLLEKDMAAAKADQRVAATKAADALGPAFDGN